MKYKKKKFFCLISILLSACLLCSCGAYEPDTHFPAKISAEMSMAFKEYCQTYEVSGGACRLIDGGGNILWNETWGNMTDNSLFAVASITKMFTATVIFNLAEEGLLSFDDRIDAYLPDETVDGIAVLDGHDYSHDITVRQLLSHTSGIADYFSESSDKYDSIRSVCYYKEDLSYDFDEALAMTRELEAHFVPGTEGEAYYSDFNYQLLGKIIETATGQSLEYNYKKYIFEPLDIKNTFVFTKGMSWDGIQPIDLPCGTKGLPLMEAGEGACGGIISTMDDITAFIQGYMNGELFDVSYFKEIYQFTELNSPDSFYGMGLMMYDDEYELYGHTGSFGTAVFYCPDLDIYVIGTFNNCSTSKNLTLIEWLLDCCSR